MKRLLFALFFFLALVSQGCLMTSFSPEGDNITIAPGETVPFSVTYTDDVTFAWFELDGEEITRDDPRYKESFLDDFFSQFESTFTYTPTEEDIGFHELTVFRNGNLFCLPGGPGHGPPVCYGSYTAEFKTWNIYVE